MARGDAAARSQRKLFAQTLGLPEPRALVRVVLDGGVALEGRPNRGIAHRQARDLRRGRQIAIQERRHHRQRIGVGVEAVRLLVGRQHRACRRSPRRADRERRWRIRCDSGDGDLPAGPDSGWAAAARSSSRFEPRRDCVVGGAVGPPAAWRRHRAAAQLDEDLLPRLCRVEHVLGVGLVEHEDRRFQFLVVAGDAVRRDELAGGRTGLASAGRL